MKFTLTTDVTLLSQSFSFSLGLLLLLVLSCPSGLQGSLGMLLVTPYPWDDFLGSEKFMDTQKKICPDCLLMLEILLSGWREKFYAKRP